jgi:hypothetical protein
MSTDGSGMGECCRGESLDRIEGEAKCVEETAERSPSGVRGVVMANFARLVGVEVTMDSCANLAGEGRSEGEMWVAGCADGELSIIGVCSETELSIVEARGASLLVGWGEYGCKGYESWAMAGYCETSWDCCWIV